MAVLMLDKEIAFPDSALMHVARIAAVIFVLINGLGLVWFIDSLQTFTFFFGIVAIICALVVSLMPRRLINNAGVKWILIALCIVGIIALFSLISQDYQRTYGPDSGAIIMRLLFAFTFVSMGLNIYKEGEMKQKK